MVKIVNNNGQFRITLPKDMALAKGWGKGTILRFVEMTDGRLMLQEIKKEGV
ncbi:hypothetical protein HYU14_03120 [Candidatus Woesearchaeota archaeon]|nr:hypothetical protein [Candidatus Woesearchaeota archaeon]